MKVGDRAIYFRPASRHSPVFTKFEVEIIKISSPERVTVLVLETGEKKKNVWRENLDKIKPRGVG